MGVIQSCHGGKNANIQELDHDMIQTWRKEKRLGMPKVRKKTSKTIEYHTKRHKTKTGQEKTIRNAGGAGNFKKSGMLKKIQTGHSSPTNKVRYHNLDSWYSTIVRD